MASSNPASGGILATDDVFIDPASVTPGYAAQQATGREFCKEIPSRRRLRPRKSSDCVQQNDLTKKIRAVVRQAHLSADDELFLEQHQSLVKLVKTRRSSYNKLKERAKEVLDEPAVLEVKIQHLADLLRSSKHAVVYTGAGISTSANIPDYRGVEGVWTQLSAGQSIKMGQNLSSATPTLAHMAISALVARGLVKYVVSQNCDGLHVRSGVLSNSLSEIHGNMFTEVCYACSNFIYRVFDVSENTGLRRHSTQRKCQQCSGPLKDTIVHFGEHSDPRWPHNWIEAEKNADMCDLILCLGSSLKVLRLYKQLWLTERRKCFRPKLCIVNMQWTPKDSQASLKINGRTDDVMQKVMKQLGLAVTTYSHDIDPLLRLASPLTPPEQGSFRTQCVALSEEFIQKFPEATWCRSDKTSQTSAVHSAGQSTSNLRQNSCTEEQGQAAEGQTSSSSNTDAKTYLLPDTKFDQGCAESSYDPELSAHPSVTQGCSKISDGAHLCAKSNPITQAALTSSNLGYRSDPCTSVDMPAWFGKGCRKQVKKKGKTKRRRKGS